MKKSIVKGTIALMLALGLVLSATAVFADPGNPPADINEVGVEAFAKPDFPNVPTDMSAF